MDSKDSNQFLEEQKVLADAIAGPNEADLITAIDGLIKEGLTEQVYSQLLALAETSSFSEVYVLKLYDNRLKIAAIEAKIPGHTDIELKTKELTKARDTPINLSDFIPSDLAEPFKTLGHELNVKPEVFLCCLLTAMSALYRVGTKITLWRATGFRVSPNLFGAIVAESSQKKSPIIKKIITKRFAKLRRRDRKEYDTNIASYECAIEAYDSLIEEERVGVFPDGMPQAPKKRMHLFTKATDNSIRSQFENFPTQGMCYLADELTSLFKSPNQYCTDEGIDEEDLLSFYDGHGVTVLRADGTRVDLDDTLLSIFGFIQPGVLEKLRQDAIEANGKMARFLFVKQPMTAAPLSDSDSDETILEDWLEDIYLAIDNLPAMQFHLDTDAKKVFQHYWNALEKRRIEHPSAAVRAVIGKSIGRIGKIAINLHCLSAICKSQEITEVINRETLESAANLSLWFAQQSICMIPSLDSSLEEPNDNLALV